MADAHRSLACLSEACAAGEAGARYLSSTKFQEESAPGWRRTASRVVTECPVHGLRSRVRLVIELDEGPTTKRYA